MDVSVIQREQSTSPPCSSLILTLGILGMRLQVSTARRRCALGGMHDLTTPLASHRTKNKLNITFLTNKNTRTKREVQLFPGARRQKEKDKPKIPDKYLPKKEKRKWRLGKLSPEDFETYFIENYLVTTKATRDFKNIFTRKATSDRELHYYEPYWANGSWILYTPIAEDRISPQTWSDFSSWRLATLPTTDENSTVSWKLMRHCFPICLTLYKDFGPICATRLAEQGPYWGTYYKDFEDYCEMQYFNCAYPQYLFGFKIAHRGKCPQKYESVEMDPGNYYYVVPAKWQLDTLLRIKYPISFPQRLSEQWNLTEIDANFVQEPHFKMDWYKWQYYPIWQYREMFRFPRG